MSQHLLHDQAEAMAELQAKVNRLEAANARLTGERDNAIQEAQGWKMEAQCHKTTVHAAYQHITGATGEMGDWHGANPIIDALTKAGES